VLAHVVPGGPASSLAASQLLSSAVDRWPERFTDQVATGPDDVLSAGRRELLASRTWTRAVAAAESPRDKTVFASAGSSETSAPLRISQTRSPNLTSPKLGVRAPKPRMTTSMAGLKRSSPRTGQPNARRI
jgi:hypothetical protein